MKKTKYHAIRDGFPQLSPDFFSVGPPPAGNGDLVVFWAAGTWRNSGPGPKTEKRNFPVLGGPKRGEKVTTLSGMVVRNFLTLYVLADQTPRGRKSRNTGISGDAIRDGCLQLFYRSRFARPGLQGREIAKYGYFRPFWPRTALGT